MHGWNNEWTNWRDNRPSERLRLCASKRTQRTRRRIRHSDVAFTPADKKITWPSATRDKESVSKAASVTHAYIRNTIVTEGLICKIWIIIIVVRLRFPAPTQQNAAEARATVKWLKLLPATRVDGPNWMTADRFPLPVNMGRVNGRAFPLAELNEWMNVFFYFRVIKNWGKASLVLHRRQLKEDNGKLTLYCIIFLPVWRNKGVHNNI